MEKIICNSKLKKIILIMFIVILLFDYIMPSVVLADYVTDDPNDPDYLSPTIVEWLKEGDNENKVKARAAFLKEMFEKIENETGVYHARMDGGDTETGQHYFNICAKIMAANPRNNIIKITLDNNKTGVKIITTDKITVAETFNKYFGGQNGQNIADTQNPDKTNIYMEYIQVSVAESTEENLITSLNDEQRRQARTLIKEKYEDTGIFLSDDIINNRILNDPANYTVELDEEGNVIDITVNQAILDDLHEGYGESRDLVDAIGGILLEPVFFLVNFIADAIMGLLDKVMENEDLSLISFIPSLMSSNYVEFPDGEENYTATISNAVGFNSYPNIRYSPERIFSGKVKLLSIDFISDANAAGPLSSVRTTIASWYKALRLFAIIGLLSVLIYTGIKVMLSANAKDKAKYKEWILNWFLAVAILFSMHYIMSFVITVTDEVNTLLGNAVSDGVKAKITLGSGETVRFKTNLIGICRYMVQAESFVTKIGYEVMYIALIVYTFKFTVVYLKRVLNMAFLTLIAPIVALMYPIDKMTDGSAQGFDMWLKEYIFNALLQPMHMLMYYVLVSSAVQVAGSNPIYGIVVLAFMTEAEKLLKKIFGFDKAHGGTVGGMGSAFAAGAVASQLGNLTKQLRGRNSKPGTGGNGEKELPEPPKTVDDGNNIEDSFAKDDDEKPADDTPSPNTPPQDNNNQFPKEEGKGGLGLNKPPQDEQQNNRDGEPGYKDGKDKNNVGEGSKNPKSDSNNNSNKNTNRANRFAKGAKAVGKRLAKPIWDFDKSGKYNRRRLTRKIAKGTAGFAVGATAAAVQAGISITDGKYNAFEGIASFGAGFAGGSNVAGGMWDGAESLKGTFDKGFHSADNKKQKEEWEEKQRERYHQDWSDRDDVNKIFKDKFGEDNFKKMKEQAKVYTDRGFNDPKEVAKLMKISKESGWDNKDTIDKMRFIKQLKDQQAYGSLSDKEKQTKYIDAIIQNNNLSGDNATQVRKRYEEKFKAAAQLDKKLRK